MSRGSGFRKVNRLRRLLRRLPNDATAEIRKVIDDGSEEVLNAMQAMAPFEEGTVRAALKRKVSRDGLTARIGILQKRDMKKAFYARFLEWGTKFMQAMPFIYPAFQSKKAGIIARSEKAIARALDVASRGAGNE